MQRHLLKKEQKIVINSHEKDNGALDKLKKLTECYFVQSDLSTIDGNKKLIQEAKVKLGKIDTLINNAGTFQDTDFENINKVHHSYFDKWMDKVFVNYLQNNSGTEKVFINMAYSLNGNEFASFMMGVADFPTKLKVIMSMPKIKFIKSALSTILN